MFARMRRRDDELAALREEVRALRERVEAIPAAPRALHGAYVGHDRVLVAPISGGTLLLPADDRSLLPELVAHGVYDAPFTAYAQRTLRPGDTVLDVGANVGLFTLLFGFCVWEHGRVLAYEANPRMAAVLRENVAMNWLGDRIEVVEKAAAAAAGTLPFLAPQKFPGGGSLRPIEAQLGAHDTVERIEVAAEPLDALAGRFERVDLVKIDVEGAEEQVFAGMTGLLESGVVQRVSFELSRDSMGEEWEPFTERLRDLAARDWSFSLIAASGEPEPATLEAILERGRFPQVLMARGSG